MYFGDDIMSVVFRTNYSMQGSFSMMISFVYEHSVVVSSNETSKLSRNNFAQIVVWNFKKFFYRGRIFFIWPHSKII